MNQLSPYDLLEIQAKAEALPDLEIISPWIELITCPVCLACKPNGMVKHIECMRTFCAQCASVLISGIGHCAICRGRIWDLRQTPSTTLYYSLPPTEVWLFDNLEFKCEHCKKSFKTIEARTHINQCNQNPAFRPPDYIYNWAAVPVIRRFTVSNPVQIGPVQSKKDRLIIFHHNGNQIGSFFLDSKWPIWRVRQYVARRSNIDANELTFYRFFHSKLHDDETLGDIAHGSGSTHLTSVTEMPDFDQLTVYIALQDAGPPPQVAKPSRRARGRAPV